MRNKLMISGVLGFLGIALAASIAFAAPGNPVPPGSITTPGPGGNNCGGIGVAYDGKNILYTCADEAAIRKTDLTGANLGSVATKDASGASVKLDAIAWDATDNKLWGGNLDGAGNCRIYETDMTTGVATLKFSFTDPNCGFTYYDGLTVDKTTNTLWLSPDISKTIHHYTKAGVEIAADLIDFTSLTTGQCPVAQGFGNTGCWNSGLTIGIDGHLFAGTNGDGKIYELNPGPPASLVTQFATVSGRDEDLECGPVTNGKETILSRDFENAKIDILEAPKGTCVSPVVPEIKLDPSKATNPVGTDHTVTATVTAGGQPIVGTTVTFTVVSGPNTGATGTCKANASCTTDANGQVSFTYVSNGFPGTDTIEACFTDDAGAKHCVRAAKEWTSLTGRMTGGGTIGTTGARHGFELYCDATQTPNNLEVNWGKGNNFHLETLTAAGCSDDPKITPNPPNAGFDTYFGTGTGRYNGVSGYTAKWKFTDAGEPGTSDNAIITITNGTDTFNFSGNLSKGNQQAHNQ